MKRIIPILFFILFSFSNLLYAQVEEIHNLFLKFPELFNSGDFIKAEESMLSVLETKDTLPDIYIPAACNNLGIIKNRLGRYKEALEYFNVAETFISNTEQDSILLATIYTNKSRIYTFQKSFDIALEYLEKGIKIYLNTRNPDKSVFQSISAAYLNSGIIHYKTRDYNTALDFFNKSSELKSDKDLSDKALPYLNMAKVYQEMNLPDKAEEFYHKCIISFRDEFGEGYHRMAEVYFDYGLFLSSVSRNKESLDALNTALSICHGDYNEKHTLVSLSYKLIGDHYYNQTNCDSALFYYQKSLIAVVDDFNNNDIFSNPSIDSVIFDIRLLDNLKSKARALELFAAQQDNFEMKLNAIQKSIETIDLAMQLTDRIRINYLSEESRIYLAENEKETYLFATQLTNHLYNLTGDHSATLLMYDIVKKAKAAILRNEITENELVYTVGIPDSLRIKQDQLSGYISGYKHLILEEMRKIEPDYQKISLWKDELFKINRKNERAKEYMNSEYPQYPDLLHNTEPVPLAEIQKHLGNDETVVDYLLSNQYTGGKRKMYIFIITKNRLEFKERDIDSLFMKNVDIIRKSFFMDQSSTESEPSLIEQTDALFFMYENLVRPVEDLFAGDRIIIIPDEEIGWLPFDAFLRSRPSQDHADYEGLQYLIHDYAFSYGYSSSLIFGKDPESGKREKVLAFSPDYETGSPGGGRQISLQGAEDEIAAIFKLFRGKKFTGNMATESNFRREIQNPAILHLAMHSMTDSSNSMYSYLMFDRGADSLNDGRLFNYEISISRIKSPMVVLSTCNSGTGTLYRGEGLMSLARGFILAGASSVIKTAWEVNDETSAAIIEQFYYHLSKGKPKDEALRLAKLEYMKTNPPVYNNPYYWAAYEILGDNSKVTGNNSTLALIIIFLILAITAGSLQYYLRRRRIFFDGSPKKAED